MRSFVFDAQALLSLYLGEVGAEKVANRLAQVQRGEASGYVNIMNLTELYYILYRKSKRLAPEKVKNLISFGARIVSATFDDDLWRRAASIKADHRLSLADAFAAASSKKLVATLVTGGDTEFDSIKRLKIERV